MQPFIVHCLMSHRIARFRRLILIPFLVSAILAVFTISEAIEADLPDIPQTPADQAQVQPLGVNVNTPYAEYTPFITPDEKYLFYESDRPGGVGLTGNADLWYSINDKPGADNPGFSLPVNAGQPVNTPDFDGFPSLRTLPDGSMELYFSSFASGSRPGPRETNIYYSRRQGESWTIPALLPGLNSDFHDRMPSISPDGKRLYFSSTRPGGYGKDDIWVSEYDENRQIWREPVNLGPSVNTAASEISPSVHVDGITLYFSSNRSGGLGNYDIFVTQLLLEGGWKNPQNLGVPFNSPMDDEYPTVVRSGEYMYFSSNRLGGQGDFDIYRARVPNFAKPIVLVHFTGRVREALSEKGIEANIQVRGDFGRYDMSTGLPDGNFAMEFKNNNIYELYITAPGYQHQKYILDLRTTHEAATITKNFYLNRAGDLSRGFFIRLEYFDTRGRPVAAQAEYAIRPAMTAPSLVDGAQIALPVGPENEEVWKAYVNDNTIELTARADGFEPRRLRVPLVDIVENRASAGTNTAFLHVEMRRINEVVKIDGRSTLIETIYFGTGVSTSISGEEMTKLKDVIGDLAGTSHEIIIYGHTDARGTLERNKALSLDRALYIKKVLLQSGIEEGRVLIKGFDYSRPAVEEKDEESRSKNRRVEIFIRPTS